MCFQRKERVEKRITEEVALELMSTDGGAQDSPSIISIGKGTRMERHEEWCLVLFDETKEE